MEVTYNYADKNLAKGDMEIPIPAILIDSETPLPPIQVIIDKIPVTGITIGVYRTINPEYGFELDPDIEHRKIWNNGTYHFVLDTANISAEFFERKLVISGNNGIVSIGAVGLDIGEPKQEMT